MLNNLVAPSICEKLQTAMKISWLDKMKGGDLCATSSRLTQELFDVLRCFCHGLTASEALDAFTQLGHFQTWERHMGAAFTKAFDLKLQFESSPLKYNCRWPAFSEAFSSDMMLSADRTIPNADHGTV